MIFNFIRKIYYWNYYSKFSFCGENVVLGPNGLIARPKEISIGSNVYISKGFFISANNLVIGSNVMIGPFLVLECHNHSFSKVGLEMFNYRNEKEKGFVTIENDVWIGANVTILPNVVVGEGSIIGAGSVITKSIPPYTISVGVPCKPIKIRFTPKDLKEHVSVIKSNYSYDEIFNQWSHHSLI